MIAERGLDAVLVRVARGATRLHGRVHSRATAHAVPHAGEVARVNALVENALRVIVEVDKAEQLVHKVVANRPRVGRRVLGADNYDAVAG